jgi:hypothetical protein
VGLNFLHLFLYMYRLTLTAVLMADPIQSLMPRESVVLRSSQLSALFAAMPELSEFVHLEIQNAAKQSQ